MSPGVKREVIPRGKEGGGYLGEALHGLVRQDLGQLLEHVHGEAVVGGGAAERGVRHGVGGRRLPLDLPEPFGGAGPGPGPGRLGGCAVRR